MVEVAGDDGGDVCGVEVFLSQREKLLGGGAADAFQIVLYLAVVEAAEDVLGCDIGNAEWTIEDAHHLACHNILHQLQLLLGDELRAQYLNLCRNLLQSTLGDLGADLCGDGEVARLLEIDHSREYSVGEAVALS